jgi:hypothetical protein
MLGLGAIPGMALAVGMYFQPYSPRWLIENGREDDARAVLRRARERDEQVDEEVDDINAAAEEEGGVREVWAPKVRPLVAIGIALAVSQQLIGVNTVVYYAPVGWTAIYRLVLWKPPLSTASPGYWLMMQVGMIIGFFTAWPVNAWRIRRGWKEKM